MGVTQGERRQRDRYAVKKPMEDSPPTNQHWLQRTPTDFLQQHVNREWETSSGQPLLRKIRYFSFTIRAFIFRGGKLFLTNRNSTSGLAEELTVPTDHFDVTVVAQNDDENPPLYIVNQQEERSIAEHIRTVLSARYQHPNILQNVQFLAEFSTVEPEVRRRVEAKTWGDEEIYLCDLELSIIMSKYDGSLGNGPAFRWITADDAASSIGEHELQFVAGLDKEHVQDMFSQYRTCRENQAFQEHCVEEIRTALRARWKLNDMTRSHRFGVVARSVESGIQGVVLFTMTSIDAALRKDATEIVCETLRYQIIGRFAIEAVQLKPEIEILSPAVSADGRLAVHWFDGMANGSSFWAST
ncbi:hypothetical protein CERZMDRAFT_84415 [Cercospora zeae-maydis SCOH1-5]|uniref:Uncharacterized protein n=1 Tax=Cercospora zeae-maydis SCOH1-5 TaxID=717836 RepID=A0A6A6FH52_9PEZI|nr:hypothetical protein CERZMDRAFT_84415 [Cercospora zeae-maydis SCOH1-5]